MGFSTSAPNFTQRVPVQILCPDNSALSITGTNLLTNNPATWTINTGSVAKTQPQLNGVPVYRGTGELPPFTIDMTWKVLGINDYLKIAALVPYYVHLISFRNLGYYGRIIMSGPDSQTAANTADLVQTKVSFMPLSPSDYGGSQAVNRISVPTLTAAARGANTGYLQSGTTLYYWLTFSSDYGETTPSTVVSVVPGSNDSASLTWTWPTTTAYCTQANLYVGTVNDPTQSVLKAEVPVGLPATFIDLGGVYTTTINQQPPTVSTAYRGSWLGGVWFNEI